MSDSEHSTLKASIERIKAAERDIDSSIFISLIDEASVPPFADESLPLAGLTFAAKDNIDLLGLPTTAACPSWAKTVLADATVVAKLQAAGAICVGKTNMDQFATGLVGTRSPYGTPLNPLDPALIPGGSSSGSAVAVARGLVDFALGTDTAGSGRVPAAHNGIVGLKPSRGLISTRGVLPAVRSIDCVSIFAKTIADAWAVFQQASGYDTEDPYSREAPQAPLSLPVRRLGIPNSLELDTLIDRAAWRQALDGIDDVEIVEVDIAPLLQAAALLYNGPWVAERYAAVGEFLDTEPADANPIVHDIITSAKNYSAIETFLAGYELADLKRTCETLWQSVDLLLVPSVPGLATLTEVEADPVGRNSRLGTYTNWVNLLDQCAITVPAGKRSDGLPYSVTLIGPAGADAVVAATAARHFETPTPELEAAAKADFIDIAVVGAHLTGQPLNWQLTDPGGVFIEAAHTAANYRLYAIADASPPKPALVSAVDGNSIELEIWRLPVSAVGGLLAQIPAPLGLGTLTLSDGRTVKGFIAEPRAIEGAEDITGFGGWRTYRASLA